MVALVPWSMLQSSGVYSAMWFKKVAFFTRKIGSLQMRCLYVYIMPVDAN